MFRSNHWKVTHCRATLLSTQESGFNTDLEFTVSIRIFRWWEGISLISCRTSSCRVLLHLLFVLLVLLVSRPEQRCLGLLPKPPDGDSNTECRLADIQLYTWVGTGFESGECWHQGQRFLNGATWGRTDVPGSPYCVCEHGQVRIFYSQEKPEEPAVADTLTILRPAHGSSPTPNDLAKWPIPNGPNPRQRTVICSTSRLGVRVRSRDGCIGCKCSKNGHWLCRKPPSIKGNRTIYGRQRTHQQRRLSPRYSFSDVFLLYLRERERTRKWIRD